MTTIHIDTLFENGIYLKPAKDKKGGCPNGDCATCPCAAGSSVADEVTENTLPGTAIKKAELSGLQ